eukprot:329677-Chlamydomonas_euryale.AAC.4
MTAARAARDASNPTAARCRRRTAGSSAALASRAVHASAACFPACEHTPGGTAAQQRMHGLNVGWVRHMWLGCACMAMLVLLEVACLPACLPAHPPASVQATRLPVCLPFRPSAYVPASPPDVLPACPPACRPACQLRDPACVKLCESVLLREVAPAHPSPAPSSRSAWQAQSAVRPGPSIANVLFVIWRRKVATDRVPKVQCNRNRNGATACSLRCHVPRSPMQLLRGIGRGRPCAAGQPREPTAPCAKT